MSKLVNGGEWSRAGAKLRSSRSKAAGFLRLSNLRKLRNCEQVAAVCYRIRGGNIEFLLVRTRGSGRWTFPKGNAEPGMTHAQAAALEAFEEAGVHGRIEEKSFAQYVTRKRGPGSGTESDRKLVVDAHLCLVTRLGSAKESNRNRTWFPAEDAPLRLRQDRRADEGGELARVIAKAVRRIQGAQTTNPRGGDGEQAAARTRIADSLHRTQMEAPLDLSRIPFFRRNTDVRTGSVAPAGAPLRGVLDCEILQFTPAQDAHSSPVWKKKPKALGTGVKA